MAWQITLPQEQAQQPQQSGKWQITLPQEQQPETRDTVGEGEALLRGGGDLLASQGDLLTKIGGAFPTMADAVQSAVTGDLTTSRQDAFFDFMQPAIQQTERAKDYYAIDPEQEQLQTREVAGKEIPTGAIAHGTGTVAAALPSILAMGGPSSLGGTAMSNIVRGMAGMTGIAEPMAANRYEQLAESGVDTDTARNAMITNQVGLHAMGAVPAAVPGGIGKRVLTGAGINVPLGMGIRGAEREVLEEYPDQQPEVMDTEAIAVDTILGMLFGGVFGGRGRGSPRARAGAEGGEPAPTAEPPRDPQFEADLAEYADALEANGINDPNDPRARSVIEMIYRRKQREAERRPGQNERQSETITERIEAGEEHPAAQPWVGREGQAPPRILQGQPPAPDAATRPAINPEDTGAVEGRRRYEQPPEPAPEQEAVPRPQEQAPEQGEAPLTHHRIDPVLEGRTIDEAATNAKLPPVPDGHTRVYRAWSPTERFEDVFNVEGMEDFAPGAREGRFYTDDLRYADYFRDAYGRDARLEYVDVPDNILATGQVRPNEFVLDIPEGTPDATQARNVARDGEQQYQGAGRLVQEQGPARQQPPEVDGRGGEAGRGDSLRQEAGEPEAIARESYTTEQEAMADQGFRMGVDKDVEFTPDEIESILNEFAAEGTQPVRGQEGVTRDQEIESGRPTGARETEPAAAETAPAPRAPETGVDTGGQRPEGEAGRDRGTGRQTEGAGREETTGRGNEGEPGPGGGTRLYSNPFDPELVQQNLGKPVRKIVKRESDQFRRELKEFKHWYNQDQPLNHKSAVRSVGDVGRVLMYANRGVLRDVMTARYPNVKELKQLADMLSTDPGSGRLIDQPYEWAVQQNSMSFMNRMANALGRERNTEMDIEVGDILAGRKRMNTSTEAGKKAERLRNVLNEFHRYVKNAGVDFGFTRDYFPRMTDLDAVQADPDGAKAAAEKAYRDIGLDSETAKMAAEEWFERVTGIKHGQLAVASLQSKFTKGRRWTARADQIMADYLVRDPREVLPTYIRQMARKAEFTRRFGENGEKLDEIFAALARQGVHPKDMGIIRAAVDSSLGLQTGSKATDVGGAVSWLQTVGAIRLLPRAVIPSMAEAYTIGIQAQSPRAGFKAFMDSYRFLFGGGGADAADVWRGSEMMGIVGDAVTQQMIAARFGGGMMSQTQQKLLGGFFRATGLHQITEAQRVAGVRIGYGFITRLINDVVVDNVLVGDKRAQSSQALLNDLGISPEDAARIKDWLGDDAAAFPKVEKLMGDTHEAQVLRQALQRFSIQSVQAPMAVDRPRYANDPVGRLAYGITSFIYGFQRNVLRRTGKQVYKALSDPSLTMADRMQYMSSLVGLSILAGMQMAVSEGRERLLNAETHAERSEIEKIFLGVSRAGLTGAADPIIQAFVALRYQRPLASLMTGPYLTAYLEDMQTFGNLLIRNTETTNTAEHNALRSFYHGIMAPTLASMVSLTPAGPILRIGYGVGLHAFTSPQAARDFADVSVGEKGAETGPAARPSTREGTGTREGTREGLSTR